MDDSWRFPPIQGTPLNPARPLMPNARHFERNPPMDISLNFYRASPSWSRDHMQDRDPFLRSQIPFPAATTAGEHWRPDFQPSLPFHPNNDRRRGFFEEGMLERERVQKRMKLDDAPSAMTGHNEFSAGPAYPVQSRVSSENARILNLIRDHGGLSIPQQHSPATLDVNMGLTADIDRADRYFNRSLHETSARGHKHSPSLGNQWNHWHNNNGESIHTLGLDSVHQKDSIPLAEPVLNRFNPSSFPRVDNHQIGRESSHPVEIPKREHNLGFGHSHMQTTNSGLNVEKKNSMVIREENREQNFVNPLNEPYENHHYEQSHLMSSFSQNHGVRKVSLSQEGSYRCNTNCNDQSNMNTQHYQNPQAQPSHVLTSLNHTSAHHEDYHGNDDPSFQSRFHSSYIPQNPRPSICQVPIQPAKQSIGQSCSDASVTHLSQSMHHSLINGRTSMTSALPLKDMPWVNESSTPPLFPPNTRVSMEPLNSERLQCHLTNSSMPPFPAYHNLACSSATFSSSHQSITREMTDVYPSSQAVVPQGPQFGQNALSRLQGDEEQSFSSKHLSPDKLKVIDASTLFKQPHRASRPDHFVIILRGLPGSGKSYLAKLLRDLEVENGVPAPRIHSMDDYFMTEVEKIEENDGSSSSSSVKGKKRIMKKVMEYCYEPEMEEAYRSSMLKAFRRTVEEGTFTFIIVDDRNLRVADFAQFWATAKRSGYEVYLLEAPYKDPMGCAARNVHGFTIDDVRNMAKQWEEAPSLYLQLDVQSLIQGDDLNEQSIQEVDMDMADSPCDDTPLASSSEIKTMELPLLDDDSTDHTKAGVKWEKEVDEDKVNPKELAKSKWSKDSDEKIDRHEDSITHTSALSGLMQTYSKGEKSVHWGDRVDSSGFTIGAARRNRLLSLIIGPGSGYNVDTNPLSEEDITGSKATDSSSDKKHTAFLQHLQAERESFRAVFDRRKRLIDGFDIDDD